MLRTRDGDELSETISKVSTPEATCSVKAVT
jgi:hypothetical protein